MLERTLAPLRLVQQEVVEVSFFSFSGGGALHLVSVFWTASLLAHRVRHRPW